MRCTSAFTSRAQKAPSRTMAASRSRASSPSATTQAFSVAKAPVAPSLNSDTSSGSTKATPTVSPAAQARAISAAPAAPRRTGATVRSNSREGASTSIMDSTRAKGLASWYLPKASSTSAASKAGKEAFSKSTGKSRSRTMVAMSRDRKAASRLFARFSFCLPFSSSMCS